MGFTLSSLLLYLTIGIVFFCIAVIAMVVLFGISSTDLLKKPREMVFLLLISLALPFTITGFSSRTQIYTSASASPSITSYHFVRSSNNQITIQFTTNQPAIGYLEYKDTQTNQYNPIYPSYSLSNITSHTININHIYPTSVWIVLNGKRNLEIKF